MHFEKKKIFFMNYSETRTTDFGQTESSGVSHSGVSSSRGVSHSGVS